MLKIILVLITLVILGAGIFYLYKISTVKPQSPIIQTIGKVLGFEKDTSTEDKQNNLLSQTKDSLETNTQKTVDDVKTNIYNSVKTTLDNVFDKQTEDEKDKVAVNILGVTETSSDDSSINIDLSKDTNLNLSLSVNKKYYLKFQNIPANYCIYINNNKYQLSDKVIEIQFIQGGSYPIKTNSCDLNDKNIGNITVQ